jgi:hypothetical protein
VIAALVVIALIVAGVLVHNAFENDSSSNAGATWAKMEMKVGYAESNPDDPDPCDDLKAVAVASGGYNFKAWLSGCESVSGN